MDFVGLTKVWVQSRTSLCIIPIALVDVWGFRLRRLRCLIGDVNRTVRTKDTLVIDKKKVDS